MICCEHFIYALTQNNGYVLLKSPNVEQMLTTENLNYLCHIGDNATEETYIQVRFTNEDLLACSYVKPTQDKYHRNGVWNHTIIIKLKDYLKLVETHFIPETDKLPEKLEPIKV